MCWLKLLDEAPLAPTNALNRGQFSADVPALMERFKITEIQARTMLQALRWEGMIVIDKGRRVATIVDFDVYKNGPQAAGVVS
jgi:hypothetical protein